MDRPFVTTYSDILFTKDVVRGLVESRDELSLGVDTDWREHYKPRTQHPPHDAEKVITRGGKVERVYRTIPYEDATGEFIGVAKFGADGARRFRDFYRARPSKPHAHPEFAQLFDAVGFVKRITVDHSIVDGNGVRMPLDLQRCQIEPIEMPAAAKASPTNVVSSPAMIRSSELLPAPLAPRTPIFAP